MIKTKVDIVDYSENWIEVSNKRKYVPKKRSRQLTDIELAIAIKENRLREKRKRDMVFSEDEESVGIQEKRSRVHGSDSDSDD